MELGPLVTEAIRLALELAAPALSAALLVALVVGFVQTATSAHDASLGFVPKLLAVAFVLVSMQSWFGERVTSFSTRVFESIAGIAR